MPDQTQLPISVFYGLPCFCTLQLLSQVVKQMYALTGNFSELMHENEQLLTFVGCLELGYLLCLSY